MDSRCPKCGFNDLDNEDQQLVCRNCGWVVSESRITSDITFAEGPDGSSSVVGQFVLGTRGYGSCQMLGRTVPGQRQAREVTIMNSRRRISQIVHVLRLGSQHIDAAHRFFMLAMQHNFTQGRRTQNVVAACIYIVCRQFKTPHMLIDFSDVLQTNVYVLGSTFLKMCRVLNISPPLIDPSLYIHRFAAQLEFEEKETEVVNTALRLVQRMKRDWIQIGRRPAGICGAALFIAARLHGFRRTQSDIIQVVKICDVTLRKRLFEFELTPTSSMTPAQFATSDLTQGAECDPPAFSRFKTKGKKVAKRALIDLQSLANASAISQPIKDQDSSHDSDVLDAPSAGQGIDAYLIQATSNISSSKTSKQKLELERDLQTQFEHENELFNPISTKKKMVGSISQNHEEGMDNIHNDDLDIGSEPLRDTDKEDEEAGLDIEGEMLAALVDGQTLEKLDSVTLNQPHYPSLLLSESDTLEDGVANSSISSQSDPLPAEDCNHSHPNIKADHDPTSVPNQSKTRDYSLLDGEDEVDEHEIVKLYLLSPEEIEAKGIIWNELNQDYLEAQAEKAREQEEIEKQGGKIASKKSGTRNKNAKSTGSIETPRKRERSSMINWAAVTLQNLISNGEEEPDESKSIFADGEKNEKGDDPERSSMNASFYHQSPSSSSATEDYSLSQIQTNYDFQFNKLSQSNILSKIHLDDDENDEDIDQDMPIELSSKQAILDEMNDDYHGLYDGDY